jgi:hypothetical protein
MADHSRMKLGKKPRRYDRRTLRLARYFTPALPPPPPAVTNSGSVTNWGMMLNGPNTYGKGVPSDGLGDCTIAGVAHAIQVWTLSKGNEITVPDSTVLHYYEQWDGYNPSNPNSDQGGDELTVLKDWRKQKFSGHPLRAFADPDPQDELHVKQAIMLFGGLYIGLELPISAQTQDVWDVDASPNGQPGSWGGHCVFVPNYDAETLTCITWGELKKMTWGFWGTCCDEAHALLSTDWRPPAGFDMAALEADLAKVVA